MTDSRDIAILSYLNENARFSCKFIGEQLKLKAPTVEYRIKRMINDGLIKFTYPSFYLSNLKLIRAYEVIISLFQSDTKSKEEIIAKLISHPSIIFVNELYGAWDLRLFIVCNSVSESQKTFDYIKKILGRNVNNIDFLVPSTIDRLHNVFGSLNCKRYYNDGSFHNLIRSNRNELSQIELDDLDLGIINLIKNDARKPYFQVAKTLGVSIGTVSNRIKNMISNNVIYRFNLYYDYTQLGYKKYYVYFNLIGDDYSSFIELLYSFNNLEFYYRFIGTWNLMVTLLIKEQKELDHFISLVLEKHSSLVKDYKILLEVAERSFKPTVDNLKEQYKNSVIKLKKK